jgi:SAM-dependent methyltransferase
VSSFLAGEHLYAGLIDYDAELQRHNEVLRRVLGVQAHEHVLDIGCGGGLTSCEAALMATAGRVLGVDVSAPAIERAREGARAQGLRNISFEHGDAQVYPFPRARFHLAMSRFGTMFFEDPVAAFANVGGALAAGGRLVMMVWQAQDRNEWDVAIREALAEPGEAAVVSVGPDPFSLGDPQVARTVLEAAGFGDVSFSEVCEPMYLGPDVGAGLDWIGGFASTREVLGQLDSAAAARALKRLRELLSAHASGDGVWFDSCAWIVTARPLNSDME